MPTPMMTQYQEAKRTHPGMVVLFRNGDFYELFEADAEMGARLLGLHLTKRDKEIPMAGFPQHQLEKYLGLLIRAGHRVAVCEQMEEAGPGKKIIRREVNRVVTPGTVTEDELLDPVRPNHLLAIYQDVQLRLGLAWIDTSTGSFIATETSSDQLPEILARLNVVECLIREDQAQNLLPSIHALITTVVTECPTATFDTHHAVEKLRNQFQVSTLKGYGFDDDEPALVAAGAILGYLEGTLRSDLGHIRVLKRQVSGEYLVLDSVTRRCLELTRSLRENQREGSVLGCIDRTLTPMGARYLHDALLMPLNQRSEIETRLDAVEEFKNDHALRHQLRELLHWTADLQRLTTRVSTNRASPRDVAAILRTLRLLPKLKAKISGRRSAAIQQLESGLELCPDLRDVLERATVDEPPLSAKEGGIIREGYRSDLDELRRLARDGKDWIARYQSEEALRTGIASLKVGFTDVMGYYIEITNANESRVPTDYIHERTLKNCKRYSTPRLKEYEEKVVTAQERANAMENELFHHVCEQISRESERLYRTAHILAVTDFLAGLAELAAEQGYTRPQIVDEPVLTIHDGRHPVLDQKLPPGTFVPNDTNLSSSDGLFWLITGPNMSGKSTFIRQVALLTLLAHVGSFIPAKSAKIGITDRIFTRIGASDEISRGLSTFMVEMTEAANILNNATSQSLVILDEIGRGTSTYDGVSLAWAITEHLHNETRCRALFATHYHELSQLSRELSHLRNYTVLVKELEREVIFLHKIAAGSADRSYGIHVARMAGIPESVLQRADQVLAVLEQQPIKRSSESLPANGVRAKASPIRVRNKNTTTEITLEPPEGIAPMGRTPTENDLFGHID